MQGLDNICMPCSRRNGFYQNSSVGKLIEHEFGGQNNNPRDLHQRTFKLAPIITWLGWGPWNHFPLQARSPAEGSVNQRPCMVKRYPWYILVGAFESGFFFNPRPFLLWVWVLLHFVGWKKTASESFDYILPEKFVILTRVEPLPVMSYHILVVNRWFEISMFLKRTCQSTVN